MSLLKINMSLNTIFCKKNIINFSLLFSGIILFAFQHPSFLFKEGLPILSYFAYIPIFLLIPRLSWKSIWPFGFLYGFLAYSLYAYWLGTFHPMGITVIAGMYGVYLLIAFPLLKLAYESSAKYGWIFQWCVWCGYEFVKTLGFSGFHYGVTAYSHWKILPMIQCVDVIGVWGLSAFITFSSAWICKIIIDKNVKKHIVSASIWICCFALILIYGFISPIDYSKEETKTVALIQQNSDPWKGGTKTYRKDLEVLLNLSKKALEENKNIDFVVWPETAFVPRIDYHYTRRENRERFELVEKLLTFINSQNVPFIIGNDHAVPKDGGGSYDYVDYNCVMLFKPGENVIPPKPETYYKMHLVPFTEYFPFDKMCPRLYQLLLNGDTHMWEPGKVANVLSIDDFYYGTPVCFEDTFSYIGRRFVNNGAEAFINLSNDTWANSLACQYQHLSMAVFRSVENRVASVRATASGQTCIVDPNGKILAMAQPNEETFLIGDFPIRKNFEKTFYTKVGDIVGIIFAIISALILIIKLIKIIFEKNRKSMGVKNGKIISAK